MPINYKIYPENWKREIRPRILQRAHHCCEFCGIPDRTLRGTRLVILTIAHLDQDIRHNDESNLAALCQKCHNAHDKWFRVLHRYQNRKRRLEQHGQQRLL